MSNYSYTEISIEEIVEVTSSSYYFYLGYNDFVNGYRPDYTPIIEHHECINYQRGRMFGAYLKSIYPNHQIHTTENQSLNKLAKNILRKGFIKGYII